jgi:hypothetical protein
MRRYAGRAALYWAILVTGWVVSAAAAVGPSSLPAELPITIHYQARWNTDHDGKQQLFEKGSCSVNIYGRMKRLEGESPFFSQYVPSGATASYTYREEIIARPYDNKNPCKGVVGTLTASGAASLGQGFGEGKAGMFLQVFSGPLGIGALLQASGDPVLTDPEALLKRMNQDPSRALYAFNVMIPLTVKVDEKPGCETLNAAKADIPINLSGIRELGRAGMEGNFSWNTGDKANTGASIEAVEAKIHYGPEPGKKRIGHATFAWGFGEVDPSVALFLHQDGERLHITDDEADVLAGRKVKLEAVVLPYQDEGTAGQWTLPASTIAGLDGYDADMSHGRILPLKEEAKRKPIVEFFCLDGSAAGKAAQVSYSATVRGKKVEGKARLKVYAPTATLDVLPERTISIGKITGKGSCAVYLGKITDRSVPGGLRPPRQGARAGLRPAAEGDRPGSEGRRLLHHSVRPVCPRQSVPLWRPDGEGHPGHERYAQRLHQCADQVHSSSPGLPDHVAGKAGQTW